MIKLLKQAFSMHKNETKRYPSKKDKKTKENNEEMMLLLYTASLMSQM
ncbi:MAG: hypothetical protein MJ238_00730 [Bacilli bacterium]|nr:hypothetical protein [Bacilli bacterium]